jgi:hypothetical protein
MIKKIDQIEVSEIRDTKKMEEFILGKAKFLEIVSSFSDYEYSRLNQGIAIDIILEERELLNKMSRS